MMRIPDRKGPLWTPLQLPVPFLEIGRFVGPIPHFIGPDLQAFIVGK